MSQKQAQRSPKADGTNGRQRPVRALPYSSSPGGSRRSILAAVVGMFIGGVVVAGGAWAFFTKPWQSTPATNPPPGQSADATGPCRACDMKPPGRFGEADGDGPPGMV